MKRTLWWIVCCSLLSTVWIGMSHAEETDRVILTRVFFQDDDARSLRWADLYAGSPPTLGKVQDVPGFPKLDVEEQSLVQMGAARGMLLVGVRDEQNGKKESGWILIDSGVGSEGHGDHSHSTYAQAPRIRAKVLDDKQGNPAHLYVYDDIFYLANDKLGGYTRIDPAAIRPADDAAAVSQQAKFIPGGGGHITLAAFNRAVGYSSWIDREGDNAGRVDVTPFATGKIGYSLRLPTGGIHGATALGGKVFFAPTDGICWVEGDATGALGADAVKVQHLSLGKEPDSDKPIRTGAFSTFGEHVLFVTGQGAHAALHTLPAKAAAPQPTKLELKLSDGSRPVGPMASLLVGGCPMALVFHDNSATDAGEQVSLIELDPNLDGAFNDARVVKVMPVGKSKVNGHAGHHDAAFVGDSRHAIYSNPGDGTLGLLRVRRWEQVGTFKVGGTPSKIETIGESSGH
ncbi:hypothetical protein [Anatilimnocola floriformis]|uniref:hypothetical protein n=1 Tax=Anatilimnocola floriformis TaxID=2948575 RepID=UPI0020C39182|nr:hypothetical protein [Anatilimnocola floriformis]